MKQHLFLAAALSALFLTACENKKKETASRLEEPYVPLERVDSAPAALPDSALASSELASPPESSPPPPAAAPADEVLAPTDAAGSRTYVVQKGDTLYGLARKFYNDQTRWKSIWEANRTRLSDPDQLSIGMRLIIP